MKSKAATLESLREWEKELSFVRLKMVGLENDTKELVDLEKVESELIARISHNKNIQIKL